MNTNVKGIYILQCTPIKLGDSYLKLLSKIPNSCIKILSGGWEIYKIDQCSRILLDSLIKKES